MSKLNAEELAANRYPNPTAMIPQPDGTFLNINHSATAYAAAIREVAQPIADERDKLRKALERALCAYEQDYSTPDNAAMSGMPEDPEKIIRAILAKYPKP
jgi:hypothetical protein